MKISELPDQVRKVAEERRAQNDARFITHGIERDISYNPDDLSKAFVWGDDGENFLFWSDWHDAAAPTS